MDQLVNKSFYSILWTFNVSLFSGSPNNSKHSFFPFFYLIVEPWHGYIMIEFWHQALSLSIYYNSILFFYEKINSCMWIVKDMLKI